MAKDTIDTLSIQINSSSQGATVAINKLIENLGKLNGALENYAGDSNKYSKAMSNIADGLNTLNNAMKGIDSERLRDAASSINALANAGKKLNNSLGNLGMSKATKDAEGLSKEMDKAVKSIMAFYGVGEGAAKKISGDFANFMNGTTWENGNIKDFSNEATAAWFNIADTLRAEAGRTGEEVGTTFSGSLLEYLKSNPMPVHLPFSWKEIAGDFASAKSELASVFGVGGWTFSSPNNGDISEFARQVNEDLGMNLDVSSDVDAFMSLSQAVSQAKSEMNGFAQSTGPVEIDLNQLYAVLEKAGSSVERFKSGMSSSDSNPIQSFVTNLKSLENVNVREHPELAELAANVSKLGHKGATTAIANMPLLAAGMEALGKMQIPDFPNLENLTNFIAAFNKLGSKKANASLGNIQPVIDGLKKLSELSNVPFPDATKLMELANAFSALGRGTTTTAIQNIPQLATAFKELMTTLSNAPEVSNNVIELASALAQLTSGGASFSRATTEANKLNAQINRMASTFKGVIAKSRETSNRILSFGKNLLMSARNATSAGRSYSNLASKIGLLYAKFWLLLRAVRLVNRIIGVASALTEVQNVVDTTFGNMAYKIEEFSKSAIKSFGMSELSAKQFASRFQAMGNAMGITGQQVAKAQQLINTKKTASGMTAGYNQASKSMADMSINLTKLTADMASFYDIEQETVAKALQSGVMAGQTRPLSLAA